MAQAQPALTEETPLERGLLGATDLSLAGVLFIVPLIMGGNLAIGRFVLLCCVLAAAGAWCLRQFLTTRSSWNRSGAEWLLVAAVALVLVQWLPLPVGIVQAVSPKLTAVLPLWAGTGEAGQLGTWSQITLTPEATRGGLVLLLAYVLLFQVTLQRVRRIEDAERLLTWIGGAAISMAALGLLQYLIPNGKYLWLFDHPYGAADDYVKGSFGNRNHFADYLALGVGPLIWCVLQLLSTRKAQTPARFGTAAAGRSMGDDLKVGLMLCALGMVMFAALLSFSRGGAIALFLATVVCLGILYRAGRIGPMFAAGLLGIGLMVGAFLMVYGQEQLAGRLDDFTEGELDSLDHGGGRRAIWTAVLTGMADFPVLGTGVGSHREVYPIYFTGTRAREYSHAESGIIQLGLETGAVGWVLLGVAIIYCASWTLGSLGKGTDPRAVASVAAFAGGLVGNIVHSAGDFMWYMPGLMALVVISAAALNRSWQMLSIERTGTRFQWPVPRIAWVAAGVGVVAFGGWAVPLTLAETQAEPHWHQYLRMVIDKNEDDEEELPAADPKSQIGELALTVKLYPDHARAHLRLARLYLIQFHRLQAKSDNPMTVEQLRDAVSASGFASREEMYAWLDRAVGKHRKYLDIALRHTRRSLELAPTQADGYLYLAKLSFLEGTGPEVRTAALDQAFQLRQHDGHILFALGKECFLEGNVEQALIYWKASFKSERSQASRLIYMLAGRVPVSFFLDNFEPNTQELKQLVDVYRQLTETPADMPTLLAQYGTALTQEAETQEGETAAEIWTRAYKAFAEINDAERAIPALKQAVAADPNGYDNRFVLGTVLYKLGDLEGANEQIQWCSSRKPDDERLRTLAQRMLLQRPRAVSDSGNNTLR